MIPRYTRPQMAHLWSDQNKFSILLEIELLACEAQSQLGIVPASVVAKLRQKARFDIERIQVIEKEVKHDVIAFLTNLAENVGDGSEYLHFGMTSSDVLDTCLSLQLKQSCHLLEGDMHLLLESLKQQAFAHQHQVCIGRSHGMHASPTTLGLKFARFYQEFSRHLERLERARAEISVCAISGTVGTYDTIDPFVEEYVAKKLELDLEVISSQVIPRDRHAVFFTTAAIIASSIENLAIEIRSSQRTEVSELSEPFSDRQKGSSAMPHKTNPILSENLTGLARTIRAQVIPALENIALWHERDISHSSVERIIAPEVCILLDFALSRLTHIIKNLVVNPEKISYNLALTKGMIFSHPLLLKLVRKGMKREDAYRIIQRHALRAGENNKNFATILLQDAELQKILSKEELEKILTQPIAPENVEMLFERVFKTRSKDTC